MTTTQTITNITNAKTLDLYREVEPGDLAAFDEAKLTDQHLADLSGQIIAALAPVEGDHDPELDTQDKPDMVETDKVLTKMLNTPPGKDKPNTPEPPTEQGAAAKDTGQEPVSGGDLDAPKPKLIAAALLRKQLKAWMKKETLTHKRAAVLIGLSVAGLDFILNGITKNPRPAVQEKILAAISGKPRQPKKKPEPVAQKPAPQAANNPTNGKGSAQFVQTKLLSWLEREQIDIGRAAATMHMSEQSLADIVVGGAMPHNNNLRQLGKYIPEIHNNMRFLLHETADK